MRVTNEQAKSALKADYITGKTTDIIKDYARDLLEARAFLKEAIGIMEFYNGDDINYFIEKSKEYTK